MKQSTTFAQVATNQFDYLSSALCANTPPCKKHSSSRKFLTLSISLRLLLVMFLTLTVSANVWAETETITLSNFGWSNASVQSSITATSATISLAKNSAGTAPTYYTSDGLRIYGVKNATTGGTISFTPKKGITISKIVFTHTSEKSGVLAIKTGVGSYSSKTWSGTLTEGSTVSLVSTNNITSGNPQVKVTKIVITYTKAAPQTYNVTLSRNGVTETINDVKEGTALDDIDGTGDQGGCSPDWEFEGWSKTQRSAQNNTEVMDLVTTVDGVGPYYAVYSHTAEGGGGSSTATMSSFSAVSGNVNNDANVSYEAAKGTAANDPAVYSNVLRIYQNGGTLTITGNNEKKLTSITIGSSMATSVSYKIDGGTESSNQSITANGKFTLSEIEASSVLFTCKGTTSSSRLYLNYLSVTYSGGNTVYYTTSPSCTTQTTITLKPNGGNGDDETYTTEETSYTLPACPFSRTGYTFAGWAKSASGTKVYDDEATIKDLDGTAVNLYAIWTPQTYDITYKDQGNADFTGTNEADLPATHTYGQQTDLVDATNSGYNFLGWFTTSDCSGSAVDHLGATEYTGNITLYAKWEEIPTTCTVTYDANGGTGTAPTDNTEYTNGATVTVLGNYGKLTKEGYAFTGWNTKADGSGDSYKHNDQFAITASTTLYAQWCEAYWKLVTNASELEDDTRIIIAAKEYDFALSTEQKTNNRGQAAITKKYNTVTFGADVQTLTLVGLQDNMFALYTGSGYLYAAGSGSNNYLKTGVSDGNDDWRFSISQGVATILAQGITNTNNQLKYNAGSDLFSCYGSGNSQKDVVIYKEVCVQDQYNVTSNLTNATAKTNPTTVAADVTSLTLNYSANTGYLLPETITVKMGGVELASGTDYTWNRETGTLTITVTGFFGNIDVKIVAEVDPCYGFAMSEVTATSTTNSITLSWTAVEGATSYNVTLNPGDFSVSTGKNSHTFEGLSPKTTYNWEVQAVKEGEGFHCEASKTGSTTTQKETFIVSWIVNGNTESPYATESVMDGNKITTYPNDPSAPSGCNKKVFVGWTNNPINTPTNETPAILYKQKSDIPAITGNTTLHAVWADEEEIDQESITTTTATVSIKDYADANQWETGTKYTSIKIDENITATAQKTTGNTDNTGKYYTSGEDWRLYQNESPTFVISSKEDVTIETVAITYAVANNGVLIYDGNQIASDNSVEVNGNSITFSVGNSSTATNGQIRVSKISVIYAINTTTKVITYSAYTTLCDECTPSEDLTLKADALTADLDINGKATITFSTTGGNGGEIVYVANPKTGVTWDNGTATFTKAGEYSITASQGKNGEYCPTTSNTVNVTITAIPHLYFVTEPANPIVFDPVECGGNTRVEDKKSVSVQAYNLAAAVTAQVTGPYKIARTSGATLNDYTTSLTLRNNITDGKINGDDDVIYILSFPPAGSSEPTEGTLTFTTTNGNTLTVNLSTPTITCTPRTLTFNDRGIKTTQEYYAGNEVPEPATPTGVCGEYEFDGWALAKVESGSTTYAKVEFPYIMPANNQTVLHAVYRYTEVGIPEDKFMSVDANIGELESGKDYVLTGYYDSEEHNGDDEEYAVSINAYENGKYTTKVVDVNVSSTLYEEGIPYYELNTSDDEIIWTITGDNINGYTFQNKSNSKYLNVSNDVLGLSDTPSAFTIVHETGVEDRVDVYYMSLLIQPKGSSNYLSSYNKEDVGVLFNIFRSNTLSLFLYKRATTPLYTTTPDCHPSVTLISDGEVYVTATNGRGIMAATPLTLTTTDLAPNTEIAISSNSNDIYFSTERNTNFAMAQASQPKTSLTLPTNEGGELETQLYIHYKPSTDGNGTPAEVVVTADVSTHNPPFTAQKTIHVRNMPAKFVIATKAGATWYALPANMSGATNPSAVVIEVDETTMTATAPNTTPYTLWPVATINSTETDRYKAYGERLRFAAVNNGNKGLWANNAQNGTNINNYAVISNDNNTAAYEWKVTTTVVDGQWQYTLYSDQVYNQNHLCYSMNQATPAWGTYASNEAKYQLYFLPIKAETTPFDYQVVEWYPNKVLIHTTTAFSSLTAKIAGEQVANVQYTAKDANQYEITGLPLMENPAKALTLEFVVADATHTGIHTIPVVLSGGNHSVSTLAIGKGIYNYTDLVVRDGATLTVDGAANTDNTFYDVTIYPTAKISVPEGKQLSVHSLTFFGGIDEIYNGSTYELNKYGVPQLSLKGTLGKTVTTMDYIMRVNLDQMYQVGVPYDVNLGEITYWDGSAIELGDELYVSAYDGQARANLDMNNTWRWEVNFAEKVLKAGVGYTISAEPQVENDDYSILRMPMESNISSGDTEARKQVPVIAYANQHSVQIADNHKGWNYLSNPYMTAISGGEADSELVLGYLKETGTGPWEWVNDEIRYVTIPHDDGEDYSQKKFSEAELKPFKSFFVQIATDGELSFALTSRQNAPARYMEVQTEQEVEFEILLSNDKQSDNTGLLIAEQYSPAYEINADLEKMIGSMSVYTIYGGYNLAYNAISPINASEWIPMGYIAPAAGAYTFRLDDIDKIIEQVEHVYLIDYEANNIVDLMNDEYEFTTDKEQNNNRFAINIVLIQDKDNTTTGLDMILGNNAAPIKFIYHDKMYIQSGGVIYDATGKQVTNINK